MSVARLDLLTPPFFAAAALVVASGGAKLRHPGPAVRALQAARLPSSPPAVRAIGAVEIVVGLSCLIAPGRLSAAALAALYAGFAAFLARLIRAGVPGASCGCLGRQDAAPSLLHLALDVAAGTTAALVAMSPPSGIVAFSARLPLLGLPFLLGTALIAFLAYLAAAYLPEAFSAYAGRGRGPSRGPRPQAFSVGPTEGA
jgi:methylamine utilization protein MauE